MLRIVIRSSKETGFYIARHRAALCEGRAHVALLARMAGFAARTVNVPSIPVFSRTRIRCATPSLNSRLKTRFFFDTPDSFPFNEKCP